MLFQNPEPPQIKGWRCVFRSPSDQEAHLTASFLSDAGLPAEVMNRKDSTYVFAGGQMGELFVYVQEADAEEALALLAGEAGGNG